MEKIIEQNLLYDFYGELLTEHQRKVYENAVYNDLSLSEIADELGISRQGVHDLLKRCDKIMAGYEEKLKLVEKFSMTRERIIEIKKLALTMKQQNSDTDKIAKIADAILEEL
ncbi:MAG: YlxM family DNA-binding protein [Lachnospiraceae bacterium]|nr:YlxM family DNA-binding protein [Lachnospiraceae bacterium]MDD3659170.1 YlxM family DNA-binding protein [Lachnospiraceae bacterium]